jgi:aminoglycoside 6-adenylyltransferase
MNNNEQEFDMIERLIHWGGGQPLVRAMLLTSSRAVPNAPVDVFSDYDVILAVLDIHPYHEDRAWLEAFGTVLALYCDPIESYLGFQKSANVTLYENGHKIDFTLWPVEILQKSWLRLSCQMSLTQVIASFLIRTV